MSRRSGTSCRPGPVRTASDLAPDLTGVAFPPSDGLTLLIRAAARARRHDAALVIAAVRNAVPHPPQAAASDRVLHVPPTLDRVATAVRGNATIPPSTSLPNDISEFERAAISGVRWVHGRNAFRK